MNAYVEEVCESEKFHTSTKWLRTILDAKYEKLDLNKVIKINAYSEEKHNVMNSLKYYKNSNSCSMEHLVLGKQIQ